jgi:hypothetical protein
VKRLIVQARTFTAEVDTQLPVLGQPSSLPPEDSPYIRAESADAEPAISTHAATLDTNLTAFEPKLMDTCVQ